MHNTMAVTETPSGRIAVMARVDAQSVWIQVDSVGMATKSDADRYMAQLENDSSLRADVIKEWLSERWGEDAPTINPNGD